MTAEKDIAYDTARAARHVKAGKHASDIAVRSAHAALARLYGERASSLQTPRIAVNDT